MEKREHSSLRRLIALLLFLAMLAPQILVPGLLPEVSAAQSTTQTESDVETIVIAGSDFQPEDDSVDTGKSQMSAILTQMKNDYGTADGFLFCGDYDKSSFSDTTQTLAGINAVKETVQSFYGTSLDEIYVQGNHDPDSFTTDGTLSASGAHDADAYGVYVINEKDYMWYNNEEATIKNTAAALDTYLDAKVEASYSKPIFVVSHLPLHYNMRTYYDGDGLYANYIFDVLNTAGAKGLNIIFLFGHNHSNGWDDYLGGSAVYLAKGDSINIAQGSRVDIETETLNFTYMNAGYVGYYANQNTGTETDLTMTVFKFTGSDMTIARYSASGVHDLKSVGVTNSYQKEFGYDPDTTVYASSQSVELNTVLGDKTSGVVVNGKGFDALQVSKGTSAVPTGYTAYQTYDIHVDGHAYGNTAHISIPVDSSFDASKPVLVIDHQENKVTVCRAEDDCVLFTTTHMGPYTLAQADVAAVSATGKITDVVPVAVTELTADTYYVVAAHDSGWVLTGDIVPNKDRGNSLALSDVWLAAGDRWYYDGTHLRHGDDENGYIMLATKQAYLSSLTDTNSRRLVTNIYLNDDGKTFSLMRPVENETGYFLNQYGGLKYPSAAGFNQASVAADGNHYSGSRWYFYTFTDGEATLSVTPSMNVVSIGQTMTMFPTVSAGGAEHDNYAITWESVDPSIAAVDANGIVTPVKAGQTYIRATLNSVEGIAVTGKVFVDVLITVVDVDRTDSAVTATTHFGQLVGNLTEAQAGNSYIIRFYSGQKYYLTENEIHQGDARYNGLSGVEGLEITPFAPLYDSQWYYDGTNLYAGTEVDTSKYLVFTGTMVTVGENDGTNQLFGVDKSAYTHYPYLYAGGDATVSSKRLNQLGGGTYNVVGLYSGQNYVCFYDYIPDRQVSLTVTPNKDILHPADILHADETVTLVPTVMVDGAAVSGNTITWTSSDTSKATVDANGKVTPVTSDGGHVIITATMTVADGVTLSEPLSVEIPIQLVAVKSDDTGISAMVYMDGKRLKTVTTPEQNVAYVISDVNDTKVVTGNTVDDTSQSSGKHFLQLVDKANAGFDYVWYYDGTYLRYGSAAGTDNYMVYDGNNSVTLGANNGTNAFDRVVLTEGAKTFTVINAASNMYLNHYYGNSYYYAGGHANPSQWYFLQVISGEKVEMKIAPHDTTQSVDAIQKLDASVWLDNVKKSGNYEIKWTSSNARIADVSHGIVTPVDTGDVVITASLVSVDGATLDEPIHVEIPITITKISSVAVSGKTGTTYVGASNSSSINQYLTVTYADGSSSRVPVKLSMLSDVDGAAVSTAEVGVLTDLTLTYAGIQVCEEFALKILERNTDDFPDYPNEGAVFIDKQGHGVDFRSSGLAQVELTATGIPSKKGADVIIMLDTSSSMTSELGGDVSRLEVLTASLNNLVNQMQSGGVGDATDIRVAVADFNGYFLGSDSPYYIDSNDTTVNNTVRNNSAWNHKVYTGTKQLNADAFVDVHELGVDPFYTPGYTGTSMEKFNLTTASGTNYDYAFDAVYQLGEAIQTENAEKNLDRDLFVIFMSDGAPFQFNYFSSQSNTTGATYWNNWLLGTFEDSMFGANANKTYYHPQGLHWMAEAIKGDPAADYDVIRKNDSRDTDGDNWITLKGLGATMYSIGFCLEDDRNILEETMDVVIRNIASSPEYYYKADTASELENAFNLISNEIFYAATGAYVIDTMGPEYDLQLKDHSYTDASSVSHTVNPVIQFKSYSIYTNQDFMDGRCTEEQIGARKTDADGNYIYTLMEEVTFSPDGTAAYSNVLGDQNILADGLISASTFWYNTTGAAITLPNGYSLAAETFYWKLGTISTMELALSYYVYLTGSMEGTRGAGSYNTNTKAELFYTNYLGHDVSQEYPVPHLPWAKSTVGYGFYLVNEHGKPIVNQSTGQVGTFKRAVKLGEVVYQDFYWNESNDEITGVDVIGSSIQGGIPTGYELFDPQAAYKVGLSSNGLGYYTIYSGNIHTTYVEGVSTTPVTGGSAEGETVNTTNYATTSTMVWFAVVVSEDPLTVDKTVEKDGDNFLLTLEAFASGETTKLSNVEPADIVLVLDQSSSMYTPLGWSADRFKVSDVPTVRGTASDTEGSGVVTDFEKKYAISGFAATAAEEVVKEANNPTYTSELLTNAQRLGYYVAVHNRYNYVYLVQYAQDSDGDWGWYYVSVDETTRSIDDLDYDTLNADSDYSGTGKGYITTVYNNNGSRDLLTNVTYYKSQYGALVESVESFIEGLRDSSVDHRVGIVGFASPFYDGWDHYDGTGLYIGDQFYLYDTDFMYKGWANDDGTYQFNKDAGHDPAAWTGIASTNNTVILDPDASFSDSGTYGFPLDTDIIKNTYLSGIVVKDENGNIQYHADGTVKTRYGQALSSVLTNYDGIMASVDAITANYQQTCPAVGLEIAENIFAARSDGTSDRDKIVILFSDGVPTVKIDSNRHHGFSNELATKAEYWSIAGGVEDSLARAEEAKANGVRLYTIGTAAMGSTTLVSNTNITSGQFVQYLSSNYTGIEATGVYSESANQYTVTVSTANATVSENQNYAQFAADGDEAGSDLTIAFDTVMSSITTPSVKLNAEDILRDVLSEYFDLIGKDAAQMAANIEVYTQAMKADGTFAELVALTSAKVTLAESVPGSNRFDIINVTGYDYDSEYILNDRSQEERTDASGNLYYGSKLVVKIPIQVRDGFWGGNGVPTNKDTSAVYDVTVLADGQSYEDVVTAFPVPNVNVPKAPGITVKDQTVYYAEDGITATDILTAITIDGKAVTVTYDAATGAYTFTPAESWMDDYAALKWTDGSATTQTPISGTQSDSYTFGVVLIPDSTDVSEVGTVVPSTGKTATATGNVKVLIPVLTFRDSMILSGKHTDKEYYDETNYLGADNVKWVDSENPFDATGKSTDISSQVTMGTEPTLTLTYTPEGSFTQDTAVDVTVMMGDEVINGIAYFEWMTCSNSLHNEAVIPTHKADAEQVDFWIHVSSIKDDSNGLITDKYATPLDNTNTRFMLTLEAYATGTVTSVKVTKPADIVLVLDHSASMRTPAGATNIQYSKNTAKGIPGALYGEQGKTDKGQLTKAELSADKGQRMGYYVAQSTSTLTWFIMEYDAATAKWIGYSVPSTESIVNKNKDLNDPTDTTYTEHTQVQRWSYSEIPGQLVFYKTQYAMLYESVLSFVQELRESDVAHSVSIVGFADSEEAGTRLYVGGDETAYKTYRSALYNPNTTAERRKELYQKAMKNVAVDSEYEELLSLVEALDTNYSYTCPAAGLQLANEVLEANPAKAEERDRIVVLFTDGIPNKKIGQANGESVDQTVIHNEIIAKAAVAKQTHGAKVYSISTATMNADAAGRLFLRYASSDYPNAASMSQPGTQANATLLYTKEADAFGDLDLAFGSITNQFTSSNVSLKDTTVLVEVLTEYFEFIKKQNASGEDYVEVLVYTQAYKGENSGDWYDKELINTLNVQITSTPDSIINKVAVSGFDYAAEYVSDFSRPVYDENGNLLIENYYGKKLVVEVMVKTRDGFWGGDNVATNDVTTGLYSPDSDIPIEVFPVPEVQVPIDVQFEMKTEDKVIYFGGLNSFDGINGDILDLTDLLKVTAGGVDVEITPEGFKPAQDWMDDFVSLNWTTKTETDSEGNEITVPDSTTFDDTISNTTPGDYPFSVTLTNKHTGATSTKTGTASVSILVPVYTFHDTTVPMGYAPNPSRENYTSGPIWVDMVTGKAGEATDPDTKPTLTETYVDVPANVNADTSIHVTIAGVNPDGSAVKNIMSAVIFRWENCGDTRNHDDAETVVTHYGTDSSIEFTIHTGTLVEDVVVIDFGLSVDIDLLANDTLLASSSTLLGVHTDNTAYGPTATGTFGGLEMVSGTTVRYTLTRAMGMQMFTHETFTYAVSYDVAGQTGTYYGTVKIIPATVIYYEDNFVTFSHDSTDEVVTGWTSTDATVTDALTKLQDTDRPGSVNPYGYDSQYVNMTQYSMGAAMKVNVYDYKDGANVHHMKTATAEFTFWGTGFDVVSLTSNKSGTIMVTVDRLDDTTTETRYLMVDTYYSYIYDEETQQWRVSTSQEENAIYQIPVMKVEDLDYGKYAVEIFVAYNDLFDHGQYTDCSYDFYLDAIRIYNPADSDTDNSVIEGIYYQDHEAKPSYQELRNMLIATGDFGADGNTAGAVFIDGSSSVGKAAIADYASYGPNNEVYLNNNQAVSFALKALSVADGKTMEDGTFASFASLVDEIHLSLKSVGGTAHVQVLNLDTGAVVLDQDITSATDLYYDISALGNANVLIRNTGGILSITNFKITYQKDSTQTIDLMSDGGVVSNPDTLNMALAMFNTVKVPTLDATGASLSYEDEVKYNVYFTADDLTDVVEMGLITFGEKLTDGTLEEALEVIPGYVVNGREYMVTTNGIPAKKMGDALYFKVYARLSDGTYAYSEILGYSAAVYASNILKKDTSSAGSKALVVALMNYGAEAQKYFGYKTDELMNSFLTEEQQSLIAGYNADAIADPVAADATKASSFTANGGFADFGVAVAFGGAFAINYYATPNFDAEVTMYYWTQADYTAADVLTVENATGAIVMTGEGELTAAVTGIAAKQLEHTVYVAMVYEADGVTYTTGVKAYSLAAYCKSIAAKDGSAMQSLAQATAVYGSYAKAYFG